MPKNLTIKFRLVAVLAVMALLMTAIGAAGILSLGRSNAELKNVYEERLVSLGQLDNVIRGMNRNQLTIAMAITGDPAKLGQAADELDQRRATISKQWEEYTAHLSDADERELAGRFAQARARYSDEGMLPAAAAARAGDVEKMKLLLHGKMAETFAGVRQPLDELIKLQLNKAKAEFENSQAAYVRFRLAVIGLLAAGVLLAATAGWWLVRSITRPLAHAVRIAEGVAAGDLTQSIEVAGNDETGKLLAALREMNHGLAGIVGNVRAASDAIGSATSEIAAGNMDLSTRTEQQAGSLEENAYSMEELTSTVRHTADNARQARQLAGSASEVAGRGGAVVAQVVDKMGAINESAYKIVEIINVIDGIAFQTNILALNAAVEAARAGEQGRGFAVVATEVRNLAQRAASAAREIKHLIDSSVAQVEDGSRLASQAGATMQEVVASVQSVTDIINEIAAASDEQSAGIGQINEAVAQMDNATQQNAALVEQAAATAGSLQEQASSLSHAVSVFRLAAQDAVLPAAASQRQPAVNSAVVAALKPHKPVKPLKPLQPGSSARPARTKAADAPPRKAVANGDGWEEF